MFAYCANNPVFSTDNTGHDHIVGAGIQIDGSVSVGSVSGCGGVEIIIYWDTEETEEAGKPIVAIYAYGGASLSYSDLTKDVSNITDALVNNIESLQGNPEQVLSGLLESLITTNASVSASGVLVVGEKNFRSAKDYEGTFTTTSVNLWFVKGSRSQGDTCHTWSVGGLWSATQSSFGISQTITSYKMIWSSN